LRLGWSKIIPNPLVRDPLRLSGRGLAGPAGQSRHCLSVVRNARRRRGALRFDGLPRGGRISRSICTSTPIATISAASLKTLTRNRDEALELLRLALQEARLDQESVERVKAQILAGLRRETKGANAIARNAFAAAAFPGHPYGLPVKGTLEGVPPAGASRSRSLSAQGAGARDGLKVAVWAMSTRATLAKALDTIFGGLPKRAELAVRAGCPHGEGTRQTIGLPVPQSVIAFGLPGLARKDKDYVPAVVMNHILGGGSFTSRLWTQVREKRGLAYSVHSSLSPFRHSALLAGATSTRTSARLNPLR